MSHGQVRVTCDVSVCRTIVDAGTSPNNLTTNESHDLSQFIRGFNNSVQNKSRFEFHFNNGESWRLYPAEDDILFLVTYICVAILGTVGNALILHIFRRKGAFPRSATYFFVTALATNDLLVCVVIIPTDIIMEILSARLEPLLSDHDKTVFFYIWIGIEYLERTCTILTVMLIICLAIEKYLAVYHPYKKVFNRRQAAITIIGSFVFGLIINLPDAVAYWTHNFPMIEILDSFYTITYTVGCFLFFITTTALYIAIFVRLYQREKKKRKTMEFTVRWRPSDQVESELTTGPSDSATQPVPEQSVLRRIRSSVRTSKSHVMTARMLVVTTIVLLVAWIPNRLAEHGFVTSKTARCSFFISNALNWFIYYATNRTFHREMDQFVRRGSCRSG